jgi:hypothetical protein
MPVVQWACDLGVVTTPGAGVADAGFLVALGRLGLRGKHRRCWGYPPSSKVYTGAQHKGVAMARRRRRPARWWFFGDDGEVLEHRGMERREVAATNQVKVKCGQISL